MFPKTNACVKRRMNRPVTSLEIKFALFQMDGQKAPRPDEFTALFFQKNWEFVEKPLVDLLLNYFWSRTIPMGLNELVICMIPKLEIVDSLNQFRPISLCNVTVKIISKVIANRLKLMMEKLAGKYQTSFISEKSTSDNITSAQEVVHSLSKRKGAKGGFILKVDLKKAYDMVDWNFLQEVLKFLGFSYRI